MSSIRIRLFFLLSLFAGTTLTGGNVNGNDFLASAGGNITLGNIVVTQGAEATTNTPPSPVAIRSPCRSY